LNVEKNGPEVLDQVNEHLKYIGEKNEQVRVLLQWAKRKEQEPIGKTMLAHIESEIKDVTKIAEKGFKEESDKKDKIINELKIMDEKISNKISVNIQVKV